MLAIVFGLLAAVGWGAPDVWLAQAVRRVGALAVLVGSITVGTLVLALAAPFVEPPEWTTRSLILAPAIGVLTVAGNFSGFSAFRGGSVAVVAPIISCEGALAAVFVIAAGEHLAALTGVGITLAVIGAVLVARGPGGGRAGALPAALAALIWGGILALSSPLADDVGPYWAFLTVRGCALLIVLPIAVVSGAGRRATTMWWRVAVWGLADAAAYLSYVVATRHGPTAAASVLAAQFGTVGALMGVLFFGERLRHSQVVGIGVVAVAVSLIAATTA